MYIDESSYKAKIGVVSIDTINNKVIRIRYTYPKGKRNAFYVGIINEENWREAVKTAHIIDRDISIGDYPSYVRLRNQRVAETKFIHQEKRNKIDSLQQSTDENQVTKNGWERLLTKEQ